jgi:glycosyltransferase involved in cell wall biosynthesis
MIKIKHVSYSDFIGGAAIASANIHNSMQDKISSKFYCNEPKLNNKTFYRKFLIKIRIFIGRIPKILYLKNFKMSLSFGLLNSNLIKILNNSHDKKQIVHLHWINRETLSIKDISRIKSHLVWTCHDMWPILGAHHLSPKNIAYSNFYFFKHFLNIDYWTWYRKKKYLKNRTIHFVAPSKWMKKKIKECNIYNKANVSVIGNPIDCDFWKKNKNLSSKNKKIPTIIFGGSKINNDKNKGLDLAIQIFNYLHLKKKMKFNVIFFGSKKIQKKDLYFSFKNYGIVNKKKLKMIYSLGDLILVTSKIESFCQVAAEAQSCSLPVICYKTSGLNDTVKNNYSGYLLDQYKYRKFADQIYKTLNNKKKLKELSNNSRKFIKNNFDKNIIAVKYINLYKKIIKES